MLPAGRLIERSDHRHAAVEVEPDAFTERPAGAHYGFHCCRVQVAPEQLLAVMEGQDV